MRVGHLLCAGLLGTFVYSPWSADPTFASVVKFGVFPASALSGGLLWEEHKLPRRVA